MNEENEKIKRAIRFIVDKAYCPICHEGKGLSLRIKSAEYIPNLATIKLTINCLNCDDFYVMTIKEEVLWAVMMLEEQNLINKNGGVNV